MRPALLQQGDILICAVVRVAGYVAVAAVGDFAGGLAELVPDGWTAAIFVDAAFDLVAGIRVSGGLLEQRERQLTWLLRSPKGNLTGELRWSCWLIDWFWLESIAVFWK